MGEQPRGADGGIEVTSARVLPQSLGPLQSRVVGVDDHRRDPDPQSVVASAPASGPADARYETIYLQESAHLPPLVVWSLIKPAENGPCSTQGSPAGSRCPAPRTGWASSSA